MLGVNRSRESFWLYAFTSATSAGVILSQISLSNVVGVLYHYDFRFLITALAFLGIGVGGICVALAEKKIKKTDKFFPLASFLFLVLVLIPFFVARSLNPDTLKENLSVYLIFFTSLFSYICAGALLAEAAMFSSESTRFVYVADLLGGSVAALGGFWLTTKYGFYVEIYLICITAVIAFFCTLMYCGAQKIYLWIGAILLLSSTFAICSLSFAIRCPLPQLLVARGVNSFSQIDVYDLKSDASSAFLGLRLNCGNIIYSRKASTVSGLAPVQYDFQFVPFIIDGTPNRVLTLGAGPGGDVDDALFAGSGSITAVEINSLFKTLVNSFRPDLSNYPFGTSTVTAVTSEARTYMAKDNSSYDLILLSFVKFGKPFGLQPFYPETLYTEEAFESYFSHLKSNGMIAIGDFPYFIQQYLVTVLKASSAEDISSPQSHILIFSQKRSDLYTTEWLIYRAKPFSQSEIAADDQLAARYDAVLLSGNEILQRAAQSPAIPLTDNRPFLGLPHLTGTQSPLELTSVRYVPLDLIVSSVGAIILLLSLFSIFICTGAPISEVPILLFFICGAIGFAAFENMLFYDVTRLFGNPDYAQTLVLVLVLFCGGCGALVAQHVSRRWHIVSLMFILAIITFLVYLLNASVIQELVSFSLAYKLIVAVALAGIPSAISAALFVGALGNPSSSRQSFRLWAWGMDSLVFMLAYIVFSFAVIQLGFNAILLTGMGVYIFASLFAFYFA